MANFLEYNPEQAYLLPPSVRDVLREDHLLFLCPSRSGEAGFARVRGQLQRGRTSAYHPALLLKVWQHAYALGMTSFAAAGAAHSGRFGVSLLTGGAQPDFGH